MRTDNALTNRKFPRNLRCGDTGRRRTEHRSFVLLWFTHNSMQTGQKGLWFSVRLKEMQIEMGPRGGIEPPSEEPQSSMLPVHHLGHSLFLTGLAHQLTRNFLLAYPLDYHFSVSKYHSQIDPKRGSKKKQE
jgi:hypothetical protein